MRILSRFKFLFSLSLIFCNSVLSEDFNIGAVLILSGDQAVYGKAMQEGIEIALQDCNKKLSPQRNRIQIFYEDSELRPKQANTAAVKLIEQNDIIAGINSSFADVMANGAVFEKKKIPSITLWDSSEQIEQLGEYHFAIGLWTPSSAEISAEFSLKKLSAKTAVIIHTQGEWSDIVAGLFKENFVKKGGKVLHVFSVNPDNNDFKTILTKTKFANPDVIYAPLMEDIIPFYKQLRQLKIKSKIVTSDIIAKEHIDQIPGLLEGVFQSNAPSMEGDKLSIINKKYQEHYKVLPNLPLMTSFGYDGLMLICDAISNNAKTPEAIKNYLYKLENFSGLSNTINFNPNGSSPLLEKMYKISNSQFDPIDF